jgi:hypothetical protein
MKIALALVVRRVASTNMMQVIAYAAPTSRGRTPHPERASRLRTTSVAAAIAARRLAISHPSKSTALIAAPPVEKRAAAPRRARTAREWVRDIRQG